LSFEGFSKEAIEFLKNVKLNNSKDWFESNRSIYNEYLLKPFQELVGELSDNMIEIDSKFIVAPFIDKTISRIHKDVRFSKDKSKYRDSMWLTFKRSAKEWIYTPAYFFEIMPDYYRYGMGFYSAKKQAMDIFRKRIDISQQSFLGIVKPIKEDNKFEIYGDMYKKSLNSSNSDEIKEWYDRKSFGVIHNCDNLKKLFTKDLLGELIESFNKLAPLYNFLSNINYTEHSH